MPFGRICRSDGDHGDRRRIRSCDRCCRVCGQVLQTLRTPGSAPAFGPGLGRALSDFQSGVGRSRVLVLVASQPPTISSARLFATSRSASRSVWTYCFMVKATSEWPMRWLRAFQSILGLNWPWRGCGGCHGYADVSITTISAIRWTAGLCALPACFCLWRLRR